MVQLSRDSFAVGQGLLSVEDGVGLLASRIAAVAGAEEVETALAVGRVLAAAVSAPVDLPPYDNSAVDGYAVAHDDLLPGAPTRLPVLGRIAAGAAAAAHRPGTATRIFTGAPMPPGTDTVFMQEDCRADGGTVVLPPGLSRGANRRRAGEDTPKGSQALAAGQRITARDVALASALGLPRLPVRRRLRAAVFSTGDEVSEPGTPLRAGALYDSNRFALRALLGGLGVAVSDLGILPDERGRVEAAIREASGTHDVVLTSGGVSMGEEDHVRAAVESVGSLVFWRLAIKPGRPVAMGVVDGTPFVGLPGNPVAVFMAFVHVVRPLVAALSGEAYRRPVPVPVAAGFSMVRKTGRREYLRVSLRPGDGGWPVATPHPQAGSGVIASLTGSDGLVELGEDTGEVAPGDRLAYLSYAELGL